MDKDNIEIPSDRLLRGLLLLKNFEWGQLVRKGKGENMARQSYLEHSAVMVRDIEWSKKFFEGELSS